MDACANRPSWKKRAFTCLIRAMRSMIGIIFIVGIASMFIRCYQEPKLNSKCEQLRLELDRLKNRRVGRQPAGQRHHEAGPGQSPDGEIRDAVRKELSLYHADKTGMPDFAMENLGGCVLTTRDTKNYHVENNWIPTIFSRTEPTPHRILRPEVKPGNCWAFEGTRGTVVIKLMSYVFITHVTLEHISPKMSPSGDITSAPRTFTLWGLQDPSDPLGKHKFGHFEYDRGSQPVQTFPVHNPVNKSFRIVEVTFHDNHGNDKYTCVYRVRIHGKMDANAGTAENPPS